MKKLLEYIPFYLLICLIAGIYIQYHTNFWSFGIAKLFFFLSILITISFLCKNAKKVIFIISILITSFFVGVSTIHIKTLKNYTTFYNHKKPPYFLNYARVTHSLKANKYYNKYIIELFKIDTRKVVGKILVNLKKDSIIDSIEIGDIIIFKANYKEIPLPKNPYQFNYKNYLAKKDIYHQVFLERKQFGIIKSTSFSFQKLSYLLHKKITSSLLKYNLSKEVISITNALLLGKKHGISKKLREDYSNAGAIHILAISGLHIGIILLIINKVLFPLTYLKNGKIYRNISSIILLWFFAYFVGLSASVVRAVTMGSFLLLGECLKRKIQIEHSLLSSMFVLLLIHPFYLFEIGFQLSYLAVFSIAWFYPLIKKLWHTKTYVTRQFRNLLAISFAIQIGTLPLAIYYFNQFPSLFFITNLLIIPFLGGILIIGFLIIILALFYPVPNSIITLYNTAICWMNAIVNWIAKQEYFLFKEITMSTVQLIGWYLLIILTLYCLQKKTIKKWRIIFAIIILLQASYLHKKFLFETNNKLIVFYKKKKTIIAQKKGKLISIYHNIGDKERLLKTYENNEETTVKYWNYIPPLFFIGSKKIAVIDQKGIYNIEEFHNVIVLLRNSPKINLERLIKTICPDKIVVDGSNYKSYSKRWKQTCYKLKTPFYDIRQNGAFIIK